MKKNKYQIITLSISALVILVSIIGYTYSYFSASVKEVNKTQTLVKTNELNITYTGGQEITAENMIPGDSFTKTFSVENTSNKEVTFNIYMENIINEFNEDLVFSLRDEEGTLINNRILPTTNEGKSYLKAKLTIGANTTKNYALMIEFKYLPTTNQNTYQRAIFNATVGIDSAQNIITGEKGVLMITNKYFQEAFWGQRENITKIVFENELVPKENAAYTYDVSEGQDKSVMSYLVENVETPSTYTLYLQGEGKIKANEDSRYLFYNFINLTEIDNLEYLDTSNVISMTGMFIRCRELKNLDLSSFDTSNVTSMRDMFWECNNLISINLTGFNTSNVTSMWGMFNNCKALITIIGIENFDTKNVQSMRGMFDTCDSLINLDLSNFNTNKVKDMAYLFSGCNHLEILNISSFDMNNVTDTKSMFSIHMLQSIVISVKDEYTQNKILSLTGNDRPASWTVDNVIIAS